MPKTLTIQPIDGINRSSPSHMIGKNQVRELENFIARYDKLASAPGTDRYNGSPLSNPVTWLYRYYGSKADGTKFKKLFCSAGTGIYLGDDVAGTLTRKKGGLTTDVIPESLQMQVGGGSMLYFMNGEEYPYYYDGNDGGTWQKSSITKQYVQGLSWLGRFWAFEPNSGVIEYSNILYPESLAGTITIGRDKDSHIRRIMMLGDYIFVFKNDSIYYINGRTPDTFGYKLVTDKFGLAAQRGAAKVGSAIVFLNTVDWEWYVFGGTESSIKPYSTELDFSTLVNPTRIEQVCCAEYDGLFRASFQLAEATLPSNYNNMEVGFPTTELNSKGMPKWFMTKGANISCYSTWTEQGEQELVTGRGDTGLVMYHYRGHDWDDNAMLYKMRTGDTGFEQYNVRFLQYWIDGLIEQGKDMDFRTYLDTRLAGSVYSEQDLSLSGETKQIGAISFPQQVRFNRRICPLIAYSKGNTLAFEIQGQSGNMALEINKIIADFEVVDQKRGYLPGA